MKAWNVRVTTEPAEEPLSRAEAKLHLKIEPDVTDEDAVVDGLIVAARRECERISRRAFVVRGVTAQLDAWPADGCIELTTPPLQSVTALRYVDDQGNEATVDGDAYLVDIHSEPGRVVLRSGASWPHPEGSRTLREAGAIQVEYTAGYGLAVDVPAEYKRAMLLLIGHWHENAEAVVIGAGLTASVAPLGVEMLLLGERG